MPDAEPFLIEPGARVSVRRTPHTSWRRVLADSFRHFDPRRQVRHPLMFCVYVLFLFLAVLTVYPRAFPDIARSYNPSFYLAVTIILFLTLWFANLSDSIAEAQGRAQADSLREIRSGIRARQVLPDGTLRWVASDVLHVGDTVEIHPGESVPLDGDVVHGVALIDESMMTGESEPVTRESGGDKTSVLGGTLVLQGTVRVRVSAARGESFLDRLIKLVEGVGREPTPNEIALSVLLAAFTITLFIVCVSFVYLANFSGIVQIDLATIVALFVCLMPTTIGALLPAIGISGVNRVARANVIAKSGKAVEASGDLDVLILDKTGTITVGSRLAVQLVAAPGASIAEVTEAAMLASTLDDTPEGRSVVRLAARRNVPARRLEPGTFKVLPFTAERRMSGLVLQDGTEIFKGSVSAMESYGAYLAPETRRAAVDAARQGMTPLVITVNKRAIGVVLLKDVVKPGIRDRLRELKTMGIRTIMCTGDNRITAAAIAKESGVDEFVAEAKPESKLQLIQREKAEGRLVAMTGDGTNDAPALARADVGLAMNSGTSAAKEAGNMVDLDNDPTKLIQVVSIGKQLLITRGALTTFSITNDVAKYFAIIPAIFVTAGAISLPGIAFLNVLDLTNPYLAILAALFFNALIIPVLIPLAIAGVPFRPRTAIDLLRRNMIAYGLGGLVSAFLGIWLCYQLFAFITPLPFFQEMARAVAHALPLGGL
ncbi:MAG TPA: potassium-transporting ATPase subunit KdpB [Thermoplasmata archaeon]|nr:potassium-transporting ATPase subunit KdpB [Thermoplasmata archaeon]